MLTEPSHTFRHKDQLFQFVHLVIFQLAKRGRHVDSYRMPHKTWTLWVVPVLWKAMDEICRRCNLIGSSNLNQFLI